MTGRLMLAEVQEPHVLKIEKVFFALQRPQNPEDYEEEGAPTLRVNPPSSTNSSTLLIIGLSRDKSQKSIDKSQTTKIKSQKAKVKSKKTKSPP